MSQAASKLSSPPAPATGPRLAAETCAAPALKTPLFSSPWWLDAATPGGWGESIVEAQGRPVARLAYSFRDYPLLGRVISQPPLTPFLGPEFYALHSAAKRQVGEQHELLTKLIDGLPRCSRFQQNFSPRASNWLPFFWRHFTQHTRYTYRLNDLTSVDAIWDRFDGSARRAIRKAQKQVTLDPEAKPAEVYRLLELSYARQGLRPKFRFEFFERLAHAACLRGHGRLLVARDAQGRAHAGVFLVWDEHAAYYLVGGSDPELRTSGAVSLLIWESIQFAATVSASFDFEGSMQPGIERFFRTFGAEQTPYFRVARNNVRGAVAEKLVHLGRRLRTPLARRGRP